MFGKPKLKKIALLSMLVVSFATSAKELNFITIDLNKWAQYDAVSEQMIGVFPDIVKAIEERTDYKINVSLAPYVRVNRELESGRQDCTILVRDEERTRLTEAGLNVLSIPVGVVAAKDKALGEYSDLYGMELSILRGASFGNRFDTDKKLNKTFDTDYQIAINKVVNGRADALAGSILTIYLLAKQSGQREGLGENLVLNELPLLFQCSKTSKNIDDMKVVNDLLLEMKESGELKTITDRLYADL